MKSISLVLFSVKMQNSSEGKYFSHHMCVLVRSEKAKHVFTEQGIFTSSNPSYSLDANGAVHCGVGRYLSKLC